MELTLRQRVDQLLSEHTTATLATASEEGAWAAAVFYAHDERLALYFLTDPATRHGAEALSGQTVSAAIHADGQDWRRIQGVQMTGRAELVGGPLDQARAWRIYLAKFPFVRDFMSEPGEFLAAYASSMGKVRFYRLVPSRIWLTDNQMRFGKREVLDLQRGG